MSVEGELRWREIGPGRMEELVARGHRQRHVFPHRVLHLAEGGA